MFLGLTVKLGQEVSGQCVMRTVCVVVARQSGVN